MNDGAIMEKISMFNRSLVSQSVNIPINRVCDRDVANGHFTIPYRLFESLRLPLRSNGDYKRVSFFTVIALVLKGGSV